MQLPNLRAGSLFSLEVLHRTGLQFYEVATYAVATGVICLAVFRGLKMESFGAVWEFELPFLEVDSRHIILGACGLHAAAFFSPFQLGLELFKTGLESTSKASINLPPTFYALHACERRH
jgi:hypothetical protein